MNSQEAAEMIRDDMKLHHDYLSGTYREALKMAISALQAQDLQSTCNNLATDTISRQAAIDAVEKRACNTQRILDAISALPSTQPEPRWIPVSERLPDEYGEYLATKHTIGWNCEEYISNDIAYFDNDGFHKADIVIAWMPLPDPFREEGDE